MAEKIEKIDVAIVGGGIMGLWCAYHLLQKKPNLSLAILETESFLGEHTSSRNSEVLHSGIYYPTGSQKHLHCLAGNRLWREYVNQKNLNFLDSGKVIAARSGQGEALEKLYQQAINNSVPGLCRLNAVEITALQPILNIDSGFSCASSAVLNVSESIRSLRLDIEAMGGIIMLKSKVKVIEYAAHKFLLQVGNSKIIAGHLVNCAGLFAVDFRAELGLQDFENYYVKGSYLKLRKKLPVEKLIYPIPPADGLGLGVHITMDTAGDQKFGPDTEPTDRIEYSLSDSLPERMIPAIRMIFKNIEISDLQLGYAGIRPKVKKEKKLLTDFVFQTAKEHGISGYYEFLGVESPGITASPSLAQKLADSFS